MRPRQGNRIATFPKGSFSFVAPQHYHIHNNFRPGFFAEKVGLYLYANKASLQTDPIDWEAMKRAFMAWSQENTKFPPMLNDITSQKFAQRVIPSHSPRSFNTDITFKPSSNFFHYYDFALLPENEAQTMRAYGPDPDHLELLSKINLHDRLAGTLGILPNHLIQLLRLTNPEDTKIIHDLRTTFWSTYRQRNLMLQEKNENEEKTLALEDCKNPFHYLLLKNNMQPIQGTCSCSSRKVILKRKPTNLKKKSVQITCHYILTHTQRNEIVLMKKSIVKKNMKILVVLIINIILQVLEINSTLDNFYL